MEMLCLFYSEGSDKLKSLFSGKAVLIIVTVISSAGGFTLGYLVGQNTALPPVSPLPAAQVGDTTSAPDVQDQNTSGKSEASSSESPAQHKPLTGSREEVVATISDKVPAAVPAAARSQSTVDTAGLQTDREADKVEMPAPGVSAREKTLYTVQAAAFRHQKDADALKRRLEAKGYEVSIRKQANSKGTIFFKVRVGEFERRKEASIAALKLSKTEGLRAFAALKK